VYEGRWAALEWKSFCDRIGFKYLADVRSTPGRQLNDVDLSAIIRISDEVTSKVSDPKSRLMEVRAMKSRLPAEFEPWFCYVEGCLLRAVTWSNLDRSREELLASGEYLSAIRCFRQGLQSAPEADIFRFKLCELYALPLCEDGPMLLAEAVDLVRRRPYDSDAHRLLGDGQMFTKQYRAAVTAYSTATELDPASPAIWNSLGNAQADAGEPDAAIRSFEQIEANGGPRFLAMYGVGIAHEKAQRYAKALEFFRIAKDEGMNASTADRAIERCLAAMRL
jgi:hypothetical protein